MRTRPLPASAGLIAAAMTRAALAATTGMFKPVRAGTYELRTRTSDLAGGKGSGWSPVDFRWIT